MTHSSDCSLYNAPALPVGPCDCGAKPHTAEDRAYNLHQALSYLLGAYKELVRETNSEPLFGESEIVTKTEAALFENRPMADWESSDGEPLNRKEG